jgi:hypothetical protein
MAGYAAAWIAFPLIGGPLTYHAAALGAFRPLADVQLAHTDSLLGLNWGSWMGVVQHAPALQIALELVYNSLIIQIILSLVVFSFGRQAKRNQELLLFVVIALSLTVIGFFIFPALGPWSYFNCSPMDATASLIIHDVETLRLGVVKEFAIGELQGIISFPSFHTVLAVGFVYVHRKSRLTFVPVLLLNCAMLVSIPSQGGHYFVDVLSGGVTALTSIFVVRWLLRDDASIADRRHHRLGKE